MTIFYCSQLASYKCFLGYYVCLLLHAMHVWCVLQEGLVRKREGYQILELFKHGKETERLEDEPLELQVSVIL